MLNLDEARKEKRKLAERERCASKKQVATVAPAADEEGTAAADVLAGMRVGV